MRITLRAWAVAVVAIMALSGCKPHGSAASSTPPAAAPPPAPVAAAPPPPPAAPASAAPAEQPAPQINVSMSPGATQPGDLPGSHDPGFLKRFQGSKIIGFEALPYEAISIIDANATGGAKKIEGEVTRIIYEVPQGHTALEVYRNYQDALNQLGMAPGTPIDCNSGYGILGTENAVFGEIAYGKMDNVFTNDSSTNNGPEVPGCYLSANAVANGRPLAIGVLVVQKHIYLTPAGQDGKPLALKDGEVLVNVDVVISKPVTNQMVTVKAADMADALATKGFVDLYGIYFDTDKTAVKPESAATLSEVASLLKIDRSLKLEVSGHTDNAGTKDHNMKLSQGRAQAVVQALATTYGIDASRLVAKGYGDTKPVAPNTSPDNMAKNRRVELRKM